MKQTKRSLSKGKNADFGAVNSTIVGASIGALTATFLLGYTGLGFAAKLTSFAVILFAYLFICAVVRVRRQKESGVLNPEADAARREAEIENRLRALEEASEYFSAALKPADMFRLISSRVNEMFPFATCVLMSCADDENELRIEHADGANARQWKALGKKLKNKAESKALSGGQIEFEDNLSSEKTVLPPALLSGVNAAAAIPLRRGDEVFAVFQLYLKGAGSFDENDRQLLEAIGERIAPLVAGSMTFETSLSNALTDALTKLPNERAFYLVLENQIAESARQKSDRALSMLAIDIVNFDDLNSKFGHATADRILIFAGENIKSQLRQMDFLARSGSDEFLAVLPTAGKLIAAEIVERIERAFAEKYFAVDASEKVFVKLNFGAATFGADGETAPQLLRSAVLRKRHRKSDEPGNVLRFPKEFAD